MDVPNCQDQLEHKKRKGKTLCKSERIEDEEGVGDNKNKSPTYRLISRNYASTEPQRGKKRRKKGGRNTGKKT